MIYLSKSGKIAEKTTATIIAVFTLALIICVGLGCQGIQNKAVVTENPTAITQEPKTQPANQPAAPSPSAQLKSGSAGISGKKPVLNYLLSSRATLKKLQEGLGLTQQQIEKIANVVRDETENIRSLYLQSQSIVKDRSLSSEEKKKEIEDMTYNEKVAEIMEESSKKIKEILGNQKYVQFVEWVEKKWLENRKSHLDVRR